jgi:hypothetical protein
VGSHHVTTRRVALVALAVLALESCARQSGPPESQTVQLPGFSVELPFGHVDKSTHLPSAGAHRVTLMPPWVQALPPALRGFVQLKEGTASVHWRAGASTPEDDRQLRDALLSSTARSLNASVLKVTEEKGRWWASIGDEGKAKVMMGGAYCPPGLTIYLNLARPDAAAMEEQARRVMQSIVCQMGSTIPQLPTLGLDLSSEYGHAESPNKDSEIYVSTHGTFVSVSPTDGNIVNAKGAVPLLSNLFGTLLHAPGSKLNLQREDVTRSDSQPAALFEAHGATGFPDGYALLIGAVYCEDLELTYLMMVAGETVTKSDAHRLVATAQCSGRSGPPLRSAGTVLGEACDAGSGKACGFLSDMIAERQVTDSPRTVDELRVRACKLKAQQWCAGSQTQ